MKHINSHIAAALCLAAAALSACDTTEEGYYVGSAADVYLIADPATQLRIPADGTAQTITVESNVPWEIEAPERTFTVTTSGDRRGNGTITVSAGVNVNESSPSATLRIYSPQFNKSVTIELVQSKMNFSMSTGNLPEAPEQGATYDFTVNSSVNWTFKAIEGELSWLSFDPSSSGEGDWNETEVKATWLPNYSTTPRSITLQLYPTDDALLEYLTLPSRFTITQAAGTLPTDVSVGLNGEADKTSVSLTVYYKSTAPVNEVGVTVTGPSGNRRVVAPLLPDAAYPQTGAFTFTLDGLEEGTDYNVVPFVVSKVGETAGLPLSFRTYAEFVFDGPKLASSSIEPTATSVSASFDIESDIDLTAVEVKLLHRSDAVAAEQRDAVSGKSAKLTWQQSAILSQNADYKFVITADYVNPNNGRTETSTLATLPFRTSTRTPQEGDNKPIK